jgi:hypothetical protein
MKNKLRLVPFYLVAFFSIILVFGCGYTTRGSLNPEYKNIHIRPVKENIEFTGETQSYSGFRSVPPFLDNSFLAALISRFNLSGGLKVVNEKEADLILETEITDYVRGGLRYDDIDNIEEYRIKMNFKYKLLDRQNIIVKQSSLSANTEQNISAGENQSQAVLDLVDIAARKLTEDIIESW